MEKELEELVKEAVEHCKVNKCVGCPFDGSPACCVAILEYKIARAGTGT